MVGIISYWAEIFLTEILIEQCASYFIMAVLTVWHSRISSVSGSCRFCANMSAYWAHATGVLASDEVLFLLAQVAQSIEDHHQEVIGFCRENGFHGLVAYDSDYALCNIPYYFSAHALKLSRNGKSLTTSQYLMHEVAKQLDLNPNRFPIFAALLGKWQC